MNRQTDSASSASASFNQQSLMDARLGRIGLMLATAVLLPLAFAPYGQFYLAWVGLAPWLILVATARSQRSAFAWGWVTGALYFLFSFVYLLHNTVPGTLGMVMFQGVYWGIAAMITRGAGLLDPHLAAELAPHDQRGASSAAKWAPIWILLRIGAIAIVWCAIEWLWGIVLTGFPWGFLGHSQSPLLAMCQIADITGVQGISFWVVLINALVATILLNPARWRQAMPAAAAVSMLLAAIAAYGVFRLSEAAQYPGPRILVVQPNDPTERGGAKNVTQEQSLEFHLKTTRDVLPHAGPIDLIVWSETTMPALNQEARDELARYQAGPFLRQVHGALIGLTQQNNVALLAGGYFVGGWKDVNGKRTGTDIRNAAFFYTRDGRQIARFDKLHLVPFGEFTPFRESMPWLYRFFLWLGPNDEPYVLNPGQGKELTTFPLYVASDSSTCRFIAPICFDGSDAGLIARLFREGTGAGAKRADLIVNLSNDGWFKWTQRPQHLQAELFRSIENRAPAARCVNTGISGFVDSCGRIEAMLPQNQAGTLVQNVKLDRRMTFYTRFGDLFPMACVAISIAISLFAIVRRFQGGVGAPPAQT